MKWYYLDVSEQAERDVERVFGWLVERSPHGAQSWYRVYDQTVESLRENPDRRARAREADAFGTCEVRQIVFATQQGRSYRVLFVVQNETVHILAVRGPGQDFVQADELELPH